MSKDWPKAVNAVALIMEMIHGGGSRIFQRQKLAVKNKDRNFIDLCSGIKVSNLELDNRMRIVICFADSHISLSKCKNYLSATGCACALQC